MRFDIYTDDMLIDGKRHDGKLSVTDVIEIVKKNVGNHWGFDMGNGEKYGDGAVFLICLDDNKVYVEGGDRFIQMLTADDKSKILWTKVYNNKIHNLTFIGEATPEEVREIKIMDDRAVIFKKVEEENQK